ncbi:hypothetical protein HYPSUDRAFT_196855 [Hypholoma sublateritium FD-334 SS-4]|uniref:Uncharacterized protein n=1 Tax=Hypholoma sublateritium (strain FD-334 SS-4) TaxID=945553 RepID=A0A0D2MZE2_HYPSF|nr:hypothetical protein HYPSUDRAFT_196855 [Hypholoma sublateritium FD-334 SS-4]
MSVHTSSVIASSHFRFDSVDDAPPAANDALLDLHCHFPSRSYGFCGTSLLVLSRGARRIVTIQPSFPPISAQPYFSGAMHAISSSRPSVIFHSNIESTATHTAIADSPLAQFHRHLLCGLLALHAFAAMMVDIAGPADADSIPRRFVESAFRREPFCFLRALHAVNREKYHGGGRKRSDCSADRPSGCSPRISALFAERT